MSNSVESVIDSMKHPEYTGENRCIPCTIVNVVIALVVAVAIAWLTIEVAVVFFLLSIGVIYFRGYLIPGTPELTSRYLPESIHRRFDHHPAAQEYADGAEADEDEDKPPLLRDDFEFETVEKVKYHKENKVNPEEYLLEAGVIEFVEELNDIRLTQEFIDQMDQRFDELDIDEVTEADIGQLYDHEADEVTDENRDYPAYKVGMMIRKWPSEPSLLSDLASEEVITDFADDWPEVPVEQRADMREMFRYLRDDCPFCGGQIIATEDTVRSCCGTWQVFAIKCDSCDHHFVELDPTQMEKPPGKHGLTPD